MAATITGRRTKAGRRVEREGRRGTARRKKKGGKKRRKRRREVRRADRPTGCNRRSARAATWPEKFRGPSR